MTYAAEDVVQSMCESAGLVIGLHPSRCSGGNSADDSLCRYHQGVEDAFAAMAATLGAGAIPSIGLHAFHDGSDGEMECSTCGGSLEDTAHYTADGDFVDEDPA